MGMECRALPARMRWLLLRLGGLGAPYMLTGLTPPLQIFTVIVPEPFHVQFA
jgi:hypothetical protein